MWSYLHKREKPSFLGLLPLSLPQHPPISFWVLFKMLHKLGQCFLGARGSLLLKLLRRQPGAEGSSQRGGFIILIQNAGHENLAHTEFVSDHEEIRNGGEILNYNYVIKKLTNQILSFNTGESLESHYAAACPARCRIGLFWSEDCSPFAVLGVVSAPLWCGRSPSSNSELCWIWIVLLLVDRGLSCD